MKFLILFVFVFLLQSCNKNAGSDANNSFRMELNDSVLIKTMREYISENHIDSTHQVITITFLGCKNKKSIYIESIIHNPYILIDEPIGYSVIDGVLVLYYSHSIISSFPQVQREVLAIIKSHKIFLEQTLDKTYDPPIWQVIKCGDKSYPFKKAMNNSSPCSSCD